MTTEARVATSVRSGRLLVRMPIVLHAELARRAKADGVSLNTYIVALLAAASSQPAR